MNRPLRIAMFVGVFPAPSETFILRQVTGLLELGHEVDLYADTRAAIDTPLHPAVTQFRLLERTSFMDMPLASVPWELPVWPLTGKTWVPGASQPLANWRRAWEALPAVWRCLWKAPALTCQVLRSAKFGYQASSLSALYRLAKLATQSRRYDVLHAHFGTVGNSFRFARQLWRAPLLVSFHGYDFSTQPRKEGPNMYASLFGIADLIMVNSAYTEGRVERLGCPVRKLRRLPMGVDLKEFVFHPRRLIAGEAVRLLTVARLIPIKGHEFVLRALARLQAQGYQIHYDIVGDGPLRQSLQQLSQQLGLDRVQFHGTLTGDQVRKLYDQAHLFALCSVEVEGDQEGQGVVLQEAQACGLPVVATAHGALPEGLLPGRSGVVVPQKDIQALAHEFRCLIERSAEWPTMGREGRAFVEQNYQIGKLNSQLAGLYTEAIQQASDLNSRRSTS